MILVPYSVSSILVFGFLRQWRDCFWVNYLRELFKSIIMYYSTSTLTLCEDTGILSLANCELQSSLQNNVIKVTTKILSELMLKNIYYLTDWLQACFSELDQFCMFLKIQRIPVLFFKNSHPRRIVKRKFLPYKEVEWKTYMSNVGDSRHLCEHYYNFFFFIIMLSEMLQRKKKWTTLFLAHHTNITYWIYFYKSISAESSWQCFLGFF